MSTNGSINLSNESPAFQSVEPPSFILSATLEEVNQQHPPVSSRMATWIFNTVWHNYPPSNQPLSAQEAEDLLLKNNDLSATVHTTAYGLVFTIHRRTTQFTQQLRESEQHV